MADNALNIEADPRTDSGKGASRRLRRVGQVPCVIYGQGAETVAMSVALADAENLAAYHRVFQLNLKGGETGRSAVVREVQRDYLKDILLHLDFQEVRLDEKLRAMIPVFSKGDPLGIHQGGILDQPLHEIEVECLPADLPDEIVCNVSELEMGDSISAPDLPMPPGVVCTNQDANAVVFLVAAPRVQEEEEEEEEELLEGELAEGEEGEEGEAAAEGAESGEAGEKEKEEGNKKEEGKKKEQAR